MKAILRSIQFSADALGVSHYTIRRLIDAGKMRAVRIGSRRLVPEDEIERVASQGAGRSKSSSCAGDAPDSAERHRETAAKAETVTARRKEPR